MLQVPGLGRTTPDLYKFHYPTSDANNLPFLCMGRRFESRKLVENPYAHRPEADNSEDGSYTNPNRFAALTIGPMYTENQYGDQGTAVRHRPKDLNNGSVWPFLISNSGNDYVDCKSIDMWRYGDEPHDDMRGNSYQVNSDEFEHVNEVWDYQPNYKGRRRYRGLIKNLSFNKSKPLACMLS